MPVVSKPLAQMMDVDGAPLVDEECVGESSKRVARPAPTSTGRVHVCHLCLEEGAISKTYKGCKFSADCWLAVRSKHRFLRSEGTCVDDDNLQMTQDSPAWREGTLNYKDKETRAVARQKTKATITSSKSYAAVTKEDDVDVGMGLTKIRYECYMEQWEKKDSDEAGDEWEELFKQQAKLGCKQKDKKGQPIVWIDDNPIHEKRKGTEWRDEERLDVTGDIDDSAVDAKRVKLAYKQESPVGKLIGTNDYSAPSTLFMEQTSGRRPPAMSSRADDFDDSSDVASTRSALSTRTSINICNLVRLALSQYIECVLAAVVL